MAQEDTGQAGAARNQLADPGGGDLSITVAPVVEGQTPGQCAWLAGALANERVKLLGCFLGVFVCYSYYGVLQETITRGRYEHGEMFTSAPTLVLIQCASGAVFARMVQFCTPSPSEDHTARWMYAVCALTCLGAMVSGNVALQFIRYPTQVLGKSCKPISVFLLGLVFARKKYPAAKYLCVLLIVAGVTLFMYRDGAEHAETSAPRGAAAGALLLLCSLVLDGLTGVLQEHMKLRHQTSFLHMMFNVNAWSSLALALPVVITGEGSHFLQFARCHPAIIYHIALFAATSAMGQYLVLPANSTKHFEAKLKDNDVQKLAIVLRRIAKKKKKLTFIFMTVVTFGPLTCSIFTTTRKFFTVLTSVVLFANPMTAAQCFGAVLVFLGLGLDAKYGRLSTQR